MRIALNSCNFSVLPFISKKAAQKGILQLCEVAATAVDNLEFMFQARFDSLVLLNRRLKDDLAKKQTIIEGTSYHL